MENDSVARFREEIEKVLTVLRKGLALHRGGVELVDADPESGVVSVRLIGTCAGCSMSDMTMKGGIEAMLVDLVPGVREVVAVPGTTLQRHDA